MSADPPHLSPGTEVSAKYKGAFCEAKIKKCQKSVKCKVSPKDGGPQISVADDAIQGHLAIGALVKVRQPDSGQLIYGIISRIIDSSIYTVVFDDGDVATLKRTQICLKGDKHYMEGDTLDKLPLTNPEHFSTPVNLLKKERRRRSGVLSHQSSAMLSDDSDYEEVVSTSRRISPRGNSRQPLDMVGKVVSFCDKKKWVPALVIKPSNHEADMRSKGLIMVKSFRDGKIYTVTDKQLREFNREAIRGYAEDKLTKAAVEKAYKYTSTKELPASWKRDEILGTAELSKKPSTAAIAPASAASAVSASSTAAADVSAEDSSSSSEEEEEKSDMFIAQLYKFMDDRSTPINKPAQLYSRDVNLSRLYQKVKDYGGFNKVCATGKWKYVAKKVGFSGISAGTEMKLLYRRYLLAFEEFHRKMGDTHMFEGCRSQRSAAAGGRNVLPPRDREQQHSTSADVKTKECKDSPDKKSSPAPSDKRSQCTSSPDIKSTDMGTSPSHAADKKAAVPVGSDPKEVPADQTVKAETNKEEATRRTPLRHAAKKDERGKVAESPRRAEGSVGRGRPSQSKANIKIEKAAKLNLTVSKEVEEGVGVEANKCSIPPVEPSPPTTPTKCTTSAQLKEENSSNTSSIKPKDEPVDNKIDNDSLLSDEEDVAPVTVSVEVDYPPGTKVKVRYGRARNVKIYDAKVVEVKVGNDKELQYSVHYNGWNTRYDEVITSERIVGTSGKCDKKKMELSRVGTGAAKCKKLKSSSQVVTSASSTGSRTPEPPLAAKPSASVKASTSTKSVKSAGNGTSNAAAISNRTTRSSATEDLSLARPTRSRSVDSTVSNLSTRRAKQRKSVLAEHVKRSDPDDESTDEDSKDSTADDVSEQATADSVSSELTETTRGDKALKRPTARAGNKQTFPAAVSETECFVETQQKVDDPSTLLPASPPQVMMSEEARSRMWDVIESVAGGQITAIPADGIHSGDSDYQPPAKRPKVEREDSGSSLPCDEAFVKIEPLTHKGEAESSLAKDSDETAELELPPLMAGGGVHSADSESKTSAVSSLADDSEASFGSDYESKSPSNRCTLSSNSALHTATSNLSLLSEQASQMETGISRARQRSSTRRQSLAAKRSPRPKYSDVDVRETSPSNDEVSHITSATPRISPSKLVKSTLPPPPRQPKYNFKIEEELAEIVDQDKRIAYLMNKMSEIRSLYSDVKSNLTSIERKRKRVRQGRDRDLTSHHSQE